MARTRTTSAGAPPRVLAPRGRTPSGDVEQALVDAAEAILVRSGPTALTVRAVATEAGVAPMGVYNRFGGKDGLIEAVLVRAFDALRAAVEPHGERDPLERLLASGRRYREFAVTNPQHYAVMFGAVMPGQAIRGDVMTERVGEHAEAAFGALVAHVEYAMAGGAIAAGDSFEVAQQIWSTVHGAVALELNGMIKTAEPPLTYERLLLVLVAGLTPREPTTARSDAEVGAQQG